MLRFDSTTQAALRYIELYLLLSTCRGIPLGTKKTHVGKTDSRGRWQRIYEEFSRLCHVFPKSLTEEWYLICVNLMVSKMPEQRRKFFEDKTGIKMSPYLFEKYSYRAFSNLTARLRKHGMLTNDH
jgi:hypothetical protein